MLDFLLSTDPSMASLLEAALRSVAIDPDRPSRSYSGPWGCLAVAGKAYPGFDVVETDRYIIVVLGGPLPRYDNSVANGSKPDDGTRWILREWKALGRLRWDEDLVGHFAVLCIDKTRNRVEAVTDIISFVPLYSTSLAGRSEVILLGSHVDALALGSNRIYEIDEVSVADFLCYGTVTYPYTLYKHVTQLSPASTHWMSGGQSVESTAYWEPSETAPPDQFAECAALLQEVIIANVTRICSGQDHVGLLLSGGEDSRVIATVAASLTRVSGLTLVDSLNREATLASKVASRIGIKWKPIIRGSTHYIDHMDSSILIAESHNRFTHAHVNGFVEHLPARGRVLGGLAADAFCKGSHVAGLKPLGFQISVQRKVWQPHRGRAIAQLPAHIVTEMQERRTIRNGILRQYRPESWGEWHSLIPASMNTHMTNVLINRRLFVSYEPFVDGKIVRLSASIPQRWKINRRFFHAATKSLHRQTRSVPHSSGIYPYWGIAANAPLLVRAWFEPRFNSLRTRLGRSPRPNQGPWPIWSQVVQSQDFRRTLYQRESKVRDLIPARLFEMIATNARASTGAALSALQLVVWADWRYQTLSSTSTREEHA